MGLHVHACFLDSECREMGAPWRLYVNTDGWSLSIGARSQWWDPWHGNTKLWMLVSLHPSREKMCEHKEPNGVGRLGKPMFAQCSRLRGHRGDHHVLRWGH